MAIRIWGRATSVNVQKVTWALAELEVPYERIDAGGHYGGLDKPEFLAMNPNARVPVMEHDGLVMFESNAIVRHLARTCGAGSLLPDDEAGLAIADQWMDWAATTLSPAFIAVFMEGVRKPPSHMRKVTICWNRNGRFLTMLAVYLFGIIFSPFQ